MLVGVDHARYLDVIRSESTALLAAARVGGGDAPVPSCPGWTIAKLVAHTGSAQHWSTAIVERRSAEPIAPRSLERAPEGAMVVDWFDAGAQHLVEVLAEAGPDAAVWTWGPGGTSGWWARRMAHETTVHRWDAEGAAGTSQPVDAALAVDGLEEFFSNFSAHGGLAASVRGDGETIHLHCTDVEGEWLLRLTAEGLQVERVHAKGDVAARGSASDLLLFVCGRVTQEVLVVHGDGVLLSRWQELAKF